MISNNSYPNIYCPCVVQINYSDGDVSFYLAENFQDGLDSYNGNLVAIFKCKPKLKP
jgi:hypothetical protein